MSQLRGSIQSIALSDVLQLLHVNRKTGKLFVTQDQKKGVLFVRNGEVIHAETTLLQGETAAFSILEWEHGLFEFATPAFSCSTSIKRSLTDLLMEAARTTDTRRRFRSVFPNLLAVPWPKGIGPKLWEGIKLFPDDHRVIPFLDGYRRFIDVIAESQESETTVYQTCLTLRDGGRLEVFEPQRELPIAPQRVRFFRLNTHIELPTDLEVWWSTMGPHRHQPIRHVRVIWPKGDSVLEVRFAKQGQHKVVAVPKELMQAWGIYEGSPVSICPAP